MNLSNDDRKALSKQKRDAALSAMKKLSATVAFTALLSAVSAYVGVKVKKHFENKLDSFK